SSTGVDSSEVKQFSPRRGAQGRSIERRRATRPADFSRRCTMQARCRRSLIWVVPFLMVAVAGWVGAQSAAAESPAPCFPIAASTTPDWASDMAADTAQGTEAPAMGTEGGMGMEKPMMSCTSNKQCKDTKMWCSKPNGKCKAKGECMAKPD